MALVNLRAANVDYRAFNTNQFGTNGMIVSVKNGAMVTNFIVVDDVLFVQSPAEFRLTGGHGGGRLLSSDAAGVAAWVNTNFASGNFTNLSVNGVPVGTNLWTNAAGVYRLIGFPENDTNQYFVINFADPGDTEFEFHAATNTGTRARIRGSMSADAADVGSSTFSVIGTTADDNWNISLRSGTNSGDEDLKITLTKGSLGDVAVLDPANVTGSGNPSYLLDTTTAQTNAGDLLLAVRNKTTNRFTLDRVGSADLTGRITQPADSVILGTDAGVLTTGTLSQDIAIGKQALMASIGTSDNVAIGASTLDALKNGSENVAIGNSAMGNATNTTGNVAIGSQAGAGIVQGIDNVVIGLGADASADSSQVVAVGRGAIVGNVNATAVGYIATANGEGAVAIGTVSAATTIGSVAIGAAADATGFDYQFTLGTITNRVQAPGGLGSLSTAAAVSIAATGWTNTNAINFVVYFDGTAVTYKVFNTAGTAVYTNAVALSGSTMAIVQPNGKVTITGTGVAGRATPF